MLLMTENEIDYDDSGDAEFGLDMGACVQENKRENVWRVHKDGVCVCVKSAIHCRQLEVLRAAAQNKNSTSPDSTLPSLSAASVKAPIERERPASHQWRSL